MTDLAKTIHIDKNGLTIDGQPFGYYLADRPVKVVREDAVCTVTIAVLAGEVTVDSALNVVTSDDGAYGLVYSPKAGE